MIRSLEVRGYRGFESYRVEPLKAVNLFVGKNNSGKTSLLEAVEIVSARYPVTRVKRIARRREEMVPRIVEATGKTEMMADVRHAFSGHTPHVGSSIRIVAGDHGGVTVIARAFSDLNLRVHEPNSEENDWVSIVEDATNTPFLVIGRVDVESDRYVTVYVPPISRLSDVVGMWNEVVRRDKKEFLLSSIQLIEPEALRVEPILSDAVTQSEGGFLIEKNGLGLQPLGSLGEGAKRILMISMAYANAQGGAVLLDEVDTGIHHTAMADLWRLLIRTSLDQNTQTFATTHSLDCVRGLAEMIELQPGYADQVAVHKLDRRLGQAITFTGEDLRDVLLSDLEVR